MKKYALVLLMILASSVFIKAQSSKDEESLKQANQNLMESYKAKDYDKALNFARQILDLNIKIYGAENEETALAYSNLGKLYYIKQKQKESAENYQSALEIYKKDFQKNAEIVAATMQKIGNVLMSDYFNLDRQKFEKAEEMYLRSLEIMETKFGKDGKEIIPHLKSLVDFYSYISKNDEKIIDKTQELFIRYYLTTAKNNPDNEDALPSIEDSFVCFLSQSVSSQKRAAERMKQFAEATKSVRKAEDVVKSDVINGTALKLEKPEYPSAARAVRASGSVLVRVLVDEKGTVIKANSFCGHPLLRVGAAQAALKSKFSPTLVDGKPVKVTGIIVYNFVP